MKLLTPAIANAKTAKNNSIDYVSAILHLAPAELSGYNVCPGSSEGCRQACLNTSGRGRFDNVQQARIRKTKLFFENRSEFMKMLVSDLKYLQRKADKENKKAVVRLNGTSDIAWEKIKVDNHDNVMKMFPNIQFYDYTKLKIRMNNKLPSNYHLTFSQSEVNQKLTKKVLKDGCNVAVVFNKLPEQYEGFTVIDGTTHDLRFTDPHNVIVGLIAKGKAKKDNTGFVVNV